MFEDSHISVETLNLMGAWPLFPLLSPDKRHSKEVMIVSCDQYTGGHRLVLWVTQYWRTQLISLTLQQ